MLVFFIFLKNIFHLFLPDSLSYSGINVVEGWGHLRLTGVHYIHVQFL